MSKHNAVNVASVLSPVDEDDIWHDYDAKKAWHALERLAGTWKDFDTEKLSDGISRSRKEGSRPW